MNGEFFIEDKKYISAKRAANLTGYATDYIGQLARAGKIDSKMIGRSWYVVEDSLLGYKREVLDVAFAGKKINKNRSLTKKKSFLKKRGRKAALGTGVVVIEEALEIAPVEVALVSTPEAAPELAPVSMPAPTPVEAPVLLPTPVVSLAAAPVVMAAALPTVKTISFAEFVARRAGSKSVRIAQRIHKEKVRALRALEVVAEASAVVSVPEPEAAKEIPAVVSVGEKEIKTIDVSALDRARALRDERLNPTHHFGDGIIDVLRGAGEFFLGSAFAFAVAVVVLASGNLYDTALRGTLAVGADTKVAMENTSDVIARVPLYVHVGAATVGRVLALSDASSSRDLAGTSETTTSGAKLSILQRIERFGARISGVFDRASLALVDGVWNLFGTKTRIEVKTTKLAVNADEEETGGMKTDDSKAPKEGMVIVPSTGDPEKDAKVTGYIKDTFSDEVTVVKHNEDGTGVIQPVFKSGSGDEYLYVIVPVQEGG